MAITEQQRNLLKRSIAELRQLRARLAEVEAANHAPVAIVGMACRLPGGIVSLDDYWRLLRDGVDAVGAVPEHRWPVERWYDPDPDAPGKMYSRWGAFLDDLESFDARFFGISPREARSMDPQQRLLLEVCWEALEDAGQTRDDLRESRTGVFIGALNRDYLQVLRTRAGAQGIDAYSASGHHGSVLSGRIAHTLGLRGPCLTLDTACSSSLAAVHLAVQSLRTGDCDLAIAGGVNVILAPETFIERCKNRMLSPQGRCRTFDDAANGIVVGEGCGLIVLRRMSDAIADGDRIRSRIIGTALNHDGHTSGLTVPSGPAQRDLLRDALRNARVEPEAVGYVEAHGTGTPLGDPIELNALVQALRPAAADGAAPLRVGSVKTNMGHLESAAGIAGLIKTALAIEHAEIPAHLNFETGNRNFDWEHAPLEVPRQTTPWQPADGRRVAGVSSFGFAGTNVHLVLDNGTEAGEPEAHISGEVPVVTPAHRPYGRLLLLSARDPQALSTLAERWRDRLAEPDADEALDDLLYTAARRRTHHRYRAAIVGTDRAALHQALERQEVVATRADAMPSRCVFVFSGQGSQWAGMGLDLMRTEPVFELVMRECEAAFRAVDGEFSVLDELRLANEATHLAATEVAQPAIFAVEVALARLWQSWGVQPAAVLGHSIGELAAAHIAGFFDLQTAAELVLRRGRAMACGNGQGTMLAVGLPAAEAEARIATRADDWIELAAVNSPRNCVLVGDPEALEAVREELAADNVFARFLRVDTPFHSRAMEASRTEFVNAFGALVPGNPTIPFYSSVLGRRLEDHEPAGIGYWGRNLRDTVRFADAMQALTDDGYDLVIEVGPHPVLSASIQQCLSEAGHGERVVTSLRRDHEGPLAMLEQAGRLFALGGALDLETLFPSQGRRVASLPAYPWQRSRHWIDPPRRGHDAHGGTVLDPVPGSGWGMARKLDTAVPTLEVIVESSDPEIVARAYGSARIFDAAAMLEAALHGHACLHGAAEHLELAGMSAPPEAAWMLSGQEQLALQIVCDAHTERPGVERVKLFVEDTAGGWRTGLTVSVHPEPADGTASQNQTTALTFSSDTLPTPDALPLPAGWRLLDGPGVTTDRRWLHLVVQPPAEASCPNLLTGCLRVAGGVVEQIHAQGRQPELALLEAFESMRCHLAGAPDMIASASGRVRIEIGLEQAAPGAWPVTTIVARPETSGRVAPCLVVRGARWSSTEVDAGADVLEPITIIPDDSPRAVLAALSRQERIDWLEDELRERVRGLMMLPPEAPIAADEGFFQMGMDSLMAVALKTGLEHTFGLELPMTLAFEQPTIAALAEDLAVRLATAIEWEPEPPPPEPPERVRTTPATRPPIGDVAAEPAVNDDLPVEPLASIEDVASLHDLLDLLEDELDD